MSIRPAPAPSQTSPSGKVIANDEDFVTELLENEGVAVGAGFRVRPRAGVPDFLRHQKPPISRRLQAHPALCGN